MWKFVVLFLCAFLAVEASITLEPRNPDIKHHGHCYAKYKNLGELSKAESKRIPNECKLATCLDNGDVIYTTCEAKKVDAPCYLTEEDSSKLGPNVVRSLGAQVIIPSTSQLSSANILTNFSHQIDKI